MKKAFTLTALVCLLAVSASAQDSAKSAAAGRKAQVNAVVQAIDLTTRMVTLKAENGKEFTTKVDEKIKNLDKVNVGDTVKAAYVEAVAVELKRGEKIEPGMEKKSGGAVSKPGEKPAIVVGNKSTVSAVIEAIDLKKNTVTFRGPEGKTRTVTVKDAKYREMLKEVQVGDVVELTYVEAVAITLEPAKKK